MGLIDKVQSFFTSDAKGDQNILWPLFKESADGSRKSERAQLLAYHEVPAFHTAINLLSETFASVEWDHLKDGQVVRDGPEFEVFQNPNPAMTGYEFRDLWMKYLDILGEAIAVMVPNEDGTIGIFPIPPLDADREEDGNWLIDHGDMGFRFPPEAVFRMTKPDLLSPYIEGKGYGDVLSDELEIIEHAATFEKSEFQNNARPDVIVNLSGGGKSAVERFKQKWTQKFGGPNKAGKPLIAQGGHLEVREMSPPLKDTLIAELRQISADKVYHAMGIHGSLIGRIEKTNRAKIRTERRIHAENNTKPRAKRFKSAWNQQVASVFQNGVTIDFQDPAPNDFQRQFEVMQERPEAFTLNEFREIAGKRQIEGLDVRPVRKPTQFETEEIGEPKEQDKETPEQIEEKEVELIYEAKQEPETNSNRARRVAKNIDSEPRKDDIGDAYEKEVKQQAKDEADEIGVAEGVAVGVVAANLHEHVVDFKNNRLGVVDSTTQSQVQSVINTGLQQNKDKEDIATDILRMPDETIDHRPARIARTEMLRARNFSKEVLYDGTDGINAKTWLSQRDAKVRSAHRKLDNETVKIGQRFRVAGASAPYPGAFGVPGLDINCRCTIVPSTIEEGRMIDESDVERYWKAFDKALNKSEDRFEDVIEQLLRFQIEKQAFPSFVRVFDLDRDVAERIIDENT